MKKKTTKKKQDTIKAIIGSITVDHDYHDVCFGFTCPVTRVAGRTRWTVRWVDPDLWCHTLRGEGKPPKVKVVNDKRITNRVVGSGWFGFSVNGSQLIYRFDN